MSDRDAGERDTGAAPDEAARGGPDSPPAVLELDHVYDALAHPRRRYLLYTLKSETAWTLAELAEKVAAFERDLPDEAVPSDVRSQVYTSLYHTHVPKLVDLDVVTFDPESETLHRAAHAEQVLAALDGMGAALDATQEVHARSEADDRDR
jgi:hypothetical protein